MERALRGGGGGRRGRGPTRHPGSEPQPSLGAAPARSRPRSLRAARAPSEPALPGAARVPSEPPSVRVARAQGRAMRAGARRRAALVLLAALTAWGARAQRPGDPAGIEGTVRGPGTPGGHRGHREGTRHTGRGPGSARALHSPSRGRLCPAAGVRRSGGIAAAVLAALKSEIHRSSNAQTSRGLRNVKVSACVTLLYSTFSKRDPLRPLVFIGVS